MAKRKWEAITSMGYVGTDTREELDLVDDMGCTEEEVSKMSNEEASSIVYDWAFDEAQQMIDIGVEPYKINLVKSSKVWYCVLT